MQTLMNNKKNKKLIHPLTLENFSGILCQNQLEAFVVRLREKKRKKYLFILNEDEELKKY